MVESDDIKRARLEKEIMEYDEKIDLLVERSLELKHKIKSNKALVPIALSAVIPALTYTISQVLVEKGYLTGDISTVQGVIGNYFFDSTTANSVVSFIISLPITGGLTACKLYDKYIDKQTLEDIKELITKYRINQGSLEIELDRIKRR